MGTTPESSGSVNIGRDVDDEYDDLVLNVKHQTQGCSTEITDFRIQDEVPTCYMYLKLTKLKSDDDDE